MTLGFTTQIKGKQTHFVSKIVIGLYRNKLISIDKASEILDVPMSQIKSTRQLSKIHTMREDIHNRWKPSMLIDFVINNRTKFRKVFAPRLPVISIQKIEIYRRDDLPTNMHVGEKITLLYTFPKIAGEYRKSFMVKIDDRWLSGGEIAELAENDGFDSVSEFFDWFSDDWKGKLIHWTDFKY